MEIISAYIHERDAEIEFKYKEYVYNIDFKYEREKTYSDQFNPGSLFGYFEKFSGYTPIDIEIIKVQRKIHNDVYVLLSEESFISEVTFETYIEIVNELETYIIENYDNN